MLLLFKCKSSPLEQKDLSLVELVVVFSIIGVIITDATGCDKLDYDAKLRRLSAELIQYGSAVNTSREEFVGSTVTLHLLQNNENLYSLRISKLDNRGIPWNNLTSLTLSKTQAVDIKVDDIYAGKLII